MDSKDTVMKIIRKIFRFLIFIPMAIFAYLGIGLVAVSLPLAETVVLIPVAFITFVCGVGCMGVTHVIAEACGADESAAETTRRSEEER